MKELQKNLHCQLKLFLEILVLFGVSISIPKNSIAQTTGEIDSANVQEIRINPKAALTSDADAEDIMSNVEYIPLETNSKSIFGNIDLLEVTDNYYIILDTYNSIVNYHPVSSILIFTKDGKFHARIDLKLTYVFAVDKDSHQIIASEEAGNFLSRYDFDGKLIDKQTQPFLFDSFVYTPAHLVAYYRGFRVEQSPKSTLITKQQRFSNILLTKPNFDFSKTFFTYDTVGIKEFEMRQGNAHNITVSGPDIYVHQPYKFHFYSLENTKLTDKYSFVFPLEYSIPSNFLFGKEFRYKWVQHLTTNYNEIFDMTNFYKASNTLAFTLYSGRMIKTFLYGLKNNILTSLSSVKVDSKNIIVPFDKPVIGSDGNIMYSWIKPAQLFYGNKNWSTSYTGGSDQLKEYLKSGKVRDNPILVKFKAI